MSSITISTIQSPIHWKNISANLQMFTEKILSIPDKKEIVVLPEMFSTGFSVNTSFAETMDGSAFQWMKLIAQQEKIVLIGSLMIEENGKFYNRLICMYPNGQFGYYDKRHLFSFAHEHKYFTAGNKRFIFSVNGWKINAQICYDIRFPVWARQNIIDGHAEYDILLNIANWPESRTIHWNTLLQARAIENQCYVIGVNRVGTDAIYKLNYSGNTSIISPHGDIIYRKENTEDIFTCTLEKNILQKVRASFPFLKDADHFIIH